MSVRRPTQRPWRLARPVAIAMLAFGAWAGPSAAQDVLPPVLDLPFGTDGRALFPITAQINAVEVLSDGSIAGAGFICGDDVCADAQSGFGAVRVLADGTPDARFGGGDGRVGGLIGGPSASSTDIAEGRLGKLVV